MKTAPESRVIDDPMLAERVRNVRYEPVSYTKEEKPALNKKDSLKEEKQQPKKQESPVKS